MTAPTHNNIGVGSFSDDKFLSVNINCVTPCLTAISASFCKLLIAEVNVSFFEKVQSITTEFFPKKLINFPNCVFDSIGLFNT